MFVIFLFQVIPITTKSVRVEWTPLFPNSWSGDTKTGGYRIKYRQIADIPTAFNLQQKELRDTLARDIVLEDLQVKCFDLSYISSSLQNYI